ncbi:MAG: rRNA maturation RNase YbeY [Candidatus Binataceae bacterium]
MTVGFRADTARAGRYANAIRSDAARTLRAIGLARCELSVAIVDNEAIRALNREYRGKDRPTDVLSFSQVEKAGAPPPDPAALIDDPATILGDVVISLDTALAQARTQGVTARERLRALLIHGVLHLIGYDHERSAIDARRMFAREREIAAALAASRRRSARR